VYRNAGCFALSRSLSATTTQEEACTEAPGIVAEYLLWFGD